MTLVTTHGGAVVNLLHLDEEKVRESLLHLCVRADLEKLQAAFDEDPEKARDLLSGKLDVDGSTGLHIAATGGHLRLTQELVSRGCEVNTRDNRMTTPLHVACSEDHAEVALELIMGQCDVNALDGNQQTALHRAVLLSSPEVVSVLIEQGGADLKIADGTKSTPLLLAAGHGRIESMALLLGKEPGLVHAANECGWTALHLAAHGKEMKKSSVKNVKFLPAVKLLLEAQASLTAVDEDQRTALHRAADTGNAETVAALLAARADIEASDITRWTPLHFACQDGHVEVAKQLLAAKAPVQRAEPVSLTPLALATMEGQVKVAELLLKHGADPDLRAKGLASASMIARKDPEKYNDILALFELGFVKHAP
mmetsp:Transcript_79500/g.246611  ORF Transcript_79500/g.246611 Transcript_79500/m.246611 type:complete len:369 (+) Transcript_79500:84-1190(+)|eukprot:CAMPEP_0204520030 /NCGR_PEP_ID=MMETSP0661-20131031/5049_1 /ASSEMBLY_ACC=CAM_ASM_000606 /TAXON_ID=109239 /ORGANISM="Alexandrium margalefi, Strain AMGDE01CS-322" /LENGTH=368 /DNA_ID=CAMNT_0051525567 /DNA_START=33 /DNA_END=1139 /DNA_ORIENTATION=-